MDLIERQAAIDAFEGELYSLSLFVKIQNLPSVHPKQKKGRWIPVTRIEKWHKEEGLVGFPPEVKEFPQCTIEWVDATEPDEVDGLRCSKCGTVYDFTEARNWCSECGAKMEG